MTRAAEAFLWGQSSGQESTWDPQKEGAFLPSGRAAHPESRRGWAGGPSWTAESAEGREGKPFIAAVPPRGLGVTAASVQVRPRGVVRVQVPLGTFWYLLLLWLECFLYHETWNSGYLSLSDQFDELSSQCDDLPYTVLTLEVESHVKLLLSWCLCLRFSFLHWPKPPESRALTGVRRHARRGPPFSECLLFKITCRNCL